MKTVFTHKILLAIGAAFVIILLLFSFIRSPLPGTSEKAQLAKCKAQIAGASICYNSTGGWDPKPAGLDFYSYGPDPECAKLLKGTSWYNDSTHFNCGNNPANGNMATSSIVPSTAPMTSPTVKGRQLSELRELALNATSEAECSKLGGILAIPTFGPGKKCRIPSTDFGKACFEPTDCEGSCQSFNGSKDSGFCSRYINDVGCAIIKDSSGAKMVLCGDD